MENPFEEINERLIKIENLLASIQDQLSVKESTKYLTRVEACSFLRISLVTLDRYIKLRRIKSYRIGGRILLLEEDLKNAAK